MQHEPKEKNKMNATDDLDLQTFIAGYLYNSRKYFITADAEDLAVQFMEEYETDLDFEDIANEIRWRQDNPND